MEQPNYYAIIPANVRYDKGLTDKAKLLYGEIAALCNKNGVCTASNAYFASLYGVNVTTISTLINNLVKKGYLESEIIYKEGTKEIQNRYLKISKDPLLKNQKENNTSNNNIKEIYKEKVEPSKEEEEEKLEYNFGVLWDEYPRKKGKAQAYKHYKAIMKAKKISNEEILNAIEAYKEEIRNKKTEEQYIMHGSTFFCSGIYDYLLKEE